MRAENGELKARLKVHGLSGITAEGGPSYDVLSAPAITDMLTTSYLGRQIICKDITGSTNDDLRRLVGPGAPEGAQGLPLEHRTGTTVGTTAGTAAGTAAGTVAGAVAGTVVIAERQTGGKGRLGRKWESPAGGVFMSALLRPVIPPDRAPLVAIVAGYAGASAIRSLTDLDAQIKWPNDVLVEGKKVCGILCEAVVVPVSSARPPHGADAGENEGHAFHPPYIICGIGINANQEKADFTEDIRETASSIRILSKQPVDRNALIAAVLNNLESALAQFERNGLAGMREKLSGLWAFLGSRVVLQNRSVNDRSKIHGTFRGVDGEGRALIEVPGEGVQAFSAGDLSMRQKS